MKRNERALKDAPTVLRHDKLIVLAAVQQYGNELKLRTDPEILLAAVTQYGSTLLYAVRFLRSDENIIFAVVMPSVRMFTAQDKRAL